MSLTNGIGSAPVTISGLSSGIDSAGIIDKLTAAEGSAVTQQQTKQSALTAKVTEWQNFNTSLLALQAQSLNLSNLSAFTSSQVSSSAANVATATSGSGATAGNHALSVTLLAQAQQVLSSGQTDTSTPLNLTGSFVINGKNVNVTSANNLSDIAASINSANAGVSASLLTISPGNVKLSLTSTSSGVVNSISASDVNGGNVLSSLGVTTAAAPTIRQSVSTVSGNSGAGSLAFPNASLKLGQVLGSTAGAAPAGSVQINGTAVALDLNTMSLNDVAGAINAAGITNVTAQVISLPDVNGNITPSSKRQLQITGASGAVTPASFTDSNDVLSSLGIVQAGFGTPITAAQDASFTVDNVAFTRSSNTVNDVIPNVSLSLLSSGPTATSTISVSQNTGSIVSAVQGLVSAYNTINTYVNNQNTFSPPASGSASGTSGNSPPLFGDYTLITVQQQLAQSLSATAGGKTLADIGVTMDSTGNLTVNTSTLTSAVQTSAKDVFSLFGVSGTATDPNVRFLSATSKTQASSAQGFGVTITTPASQAKAAASIAQTAASAAAEQLTFNGTMFGNNLFTLTVPPNSSQQNLIDLINGNSNLNQVMFASSDSVTGALTLNSKGYGANASFNVTSSLAASAANSGLGTTTILATGVDVAGTINGETATGIGNILTGKAGSKTTDGLALAVTTTSAGSLGTVRIAHGLADTINSLVTRFTDPTQGDIVGAENALNQQVDDIGKQITAMQDQLTAYSDLLTQQFAAMEQQVSQLKAQSNAFAAQIGTTPTSSTSTAKTS